MKKIYRYRKFVGLFMVISTFLLSVPPSPARAAMITTQYTIHQDSEQHSDRARIRAFLGRADVMAQMQAHGIIPEEARSRVDSLTDSEIASIAGKMDRIPAGAGGGSYTLVLRPTSSLQNMVLNFGFWFPVSGPWLLASCCWPS